MYIQHLWELVISYVNTEAELDQLKTDGNDDFALVKNVAKAMRKKIMQLWDSFLSRPKAIRYIPNLHCRQNWL